MFSFNYENKSLSNVNVDLIQAAKYKHRRSFDYGTTSFNLAGPNKSKPLVITRHNSIPSSPLHFINSSHHSGNSTPIPKNTVFIRRQSSEKCLQKRHSVDSNNSNNSDPGYSSINNKTFLSPSQLRFPRESNSPKSCHSSNVSVTGRNSSCSSMAFLSRQSSTNSSKLPTQRESEENLQSNKWFSSSSVILTRVKSMKEKFRRVVVQSVQPDDWPPPSVLFSDRYKCPSNSTFQSSNLNSNLKTYPKIFKSSSHLVKSKSIDHSSFQTTASINKRNLKNISPAGSGRNFKRERFQRSLTSYTESIDHGSNNENGIVCSDMDLKAIISTFKREEASYKLHNVITSEDKTKPTQNISKTPIGTSSVIGPGFGKRKLMRKQVSFDDEQGILMLNRKVSAIAEEIECHSQLENNTIDRQPTLMGTSVDENNVSKNKNDKEENNKVEITSEDEEENCAPYELLLLPKEIEFDEYGQTWEVYGADPDPEILGQAIQHHLERLMVCRQVVNIPNGSTARPIVEANIDNKIKAEDKDILLRVLKPLRVDIQSSENNLRFIASRLCGKWSCFASGHHDSSNTVITSIDQNH